MTDEELTIAYRVTFGTPHGQAVLADLAKFCRATETTAPIIPVDVNKLMINEGRRQAFLRIWEFSKLALEEIYELRLGRSVGQLKHGESE